MLAIAIAFLMGLALGTYPRRSIIRSAVRVALVGCLVALTKWLLLQMQSDLFVPALSKLPEWVLQSTLFAILGLIAGMIIRSLRTGRLEG